MLLYSKALKKKWNRWGTHEITIPVEEVVYAACRRPTQKDQPTGQPD
jgi:hypothetical protein